MAACRRLNGAIIDGMGGNPHSNDASDKPTRLFVSYVVQLVFRFALLIAAVWLFATDSHALEPSRTFGVADGFDFVDFVFIALGVDFLTKFFARARISSGSLKQYRMYHIPTAVTFRGGREALHAQFREIAELGRRLAADGATAVQETYSGLLAHGGSIASFTRRLLNSVDFLNVFSFDERDLAVDRSIRVVLYRDRLHEIVPVVVFWVAFNAIVAGILAYSDALNEQTALLWSLGYFLSDMVCVVLWCPLQLLLMRNRCCTTCQIFNWDAIMVATPLVFVGGWFGWVLVALAVVILVRWELAAIRHPERFDERTNARLTCVQCVDKLCRLRKPLSGASGVRSLEVLDAASADREQMPRAAKRVS